MRQSILTVLILGWLPSSLFAQEPHPGKRVFDVWCTPCHGDPVAWSGGATESLQRKYKGQIPAKLEDRTDLTEETVRYFVRNGYNGMPFFRHVEISYQEMDALADYLANH